MSRKKTKPQKKTPKVHELTVKVSVELQAIRIEPLDLANLEKLHAQMRATEAEVIMQQAARRALVQRIDPTGDLARLDAVIGKISTERSTAEKEYHALTEKIEKSLNVSLKEYAYDDKTGILQKLPQDSPSQEASPGSTSGP